MKKCLNVIRLKEQFTPKKIINQILIFKCQRNVNSKTDDVTTGGLDLQHHTDVCLHLKINAVFINHDPSSAWTESSELNRTFTTDLSEQSLMVRCDDVFCLGLNTVFPPQQNQQNPEDHVSIQLQNLQLGNTQDVKNW